MTTIQHDVPLKNKTSFRIGGSASYYLAVKNDDDLIYALKWAYENKVTVFVLGKGSNILVSDSGWSGIVIDMTGFSSIQWNNDLLTCQSGVLLHGIVKESVDLGFIGMEELAGIPGTIGGGLIMNAGAFNQNISDCLVSVAGINRKTFEKWKMSVYEIKFNYRTSSLKKNNLLITEAVFEFCKDNKGIARTVFSDTIKKRTVKQPLQLPNCGSVFKRPLGNYSGTLIEQCNLKGFTIGGAQVSKKHANFIVNNGNATAVDVRDLIVHIQECVHKEFGVLLQPEVIFVGDFERPLFELPAHLV